MGPKRAFPGCLPLIVCALALVSAALTIPARAEALERLCDSSFENCRTEVLERIRGEQVGIDVAAWFFEDSRFSTELINRWKAGLPVRVIGDPRANPQHPANGSILDAMAAAGVPIRKKVSSGIEHWKLMLFAGQNVAYFGAANFSADAYVPADPYRNFVDETIYGTDDPSVVDSFRTKYDDAWTDTTNYGDYGNAPNSSVTRRYATYPIDPELNWAPAFGSSSYRSRSVAAYNNEQQKIDVIMYRVTDQAHVDAIINAFNRGVPVRVYTEQKMYRDLSQIWHSMSVDKWYMAGIPIKDRAHDGLNHEKLVLLYGQQMTVFGSSNMTSKSSDSQHEHNYFTKKPHIFQFFVDQFDRKWNNANPLGAPETKPFAPLPPDRPVYHSPADLAVGLGTTGVRLRWYGGPWAHLYDVYFGTTPEPPLYASNLSLGPSRNTSEMQSVTLPTLAAGTTYYWKVVSKTMAHLARAGNVSSFTTAGAPPPPPPGAADIVLWTANVPDSDIHGDWVRIADASAAGGAALHNPNRSAAKIVPALASPASYFDIGFNAMAGVAYHAWIRVRAEGNSTANDSVHVQFNDSVDSLGTPILRVATTGSAEPVLQDGPGGAAPQAWGWTDNGWGSLGAPIYFAADGAHVIRVQAREDGAIVDQIVLSPSTYMTSAPGARQNDGTILASTDGSSPPPPPAAENTIVIWTSNVPSTQVSGNWQMVADPTAAGGQALRNANINAAKIAPALASPGSYFEVAFAADAGIAYHVWVRMQADGDSKSNDSVHMQFNDSLDAAGRPYAQIGTTSSAEFVLQAGPAGAAPRGWGWTENGWESAGPDVFFAADGSHVLRVQQREDGPTIDQIVLSPDAYLTTSPGARQSDTTVLEFTEDGSTPPPPSPSSAGTIVLWTAASVDTDRVGNWILAADSTAAGGATLWNLDAGAAKIAPALASPTTYFEVTFSATAGTAYHVWLRMRAEADFWANDSVHIQFSDAVDSAGAPLARIGSASSAEFVLQDGPGGAAPQGWGWTDNGWGAAGSHVYFEATGSKTLRIQQREDGAIIDQIVLSPDAYLTSPPGSRRNDTVILAAQQP